MNTPSDTPARPAMRALTPVEARVLGVLVEKQRTVPDTYPLSMNALVAGCNQKTARAPVMNLTEADVLDAIESLKRLSLVLEGSSSRVPRFEHNVARVLGAPGQAVALLAVLMLRGPQTAAELRLNTARLHDFADISSVDAFLDELAQQTPPRVVKLARTPGEREHRWMHLLCGEVAGVAGQAAAPRAATPAEPSDDELESLRAAHQDLADEIARLRAQLAYLADALGVDLAKLDPDPSQPG